MSIHKRPAWMGVTALTLLTCVLAAASAEGARTYEETPESITTPDQTETRVGTLRLTDGVPTQETARLLLDNLDLNRGVEAFMSGMPAANFAGGHRGHLELGQKTCNQVVIFDELMDSNSLFLTGNASTVYITSFLDLKLHGPIVVEIPAESGPGILVDSYTRYLTNFGPPGPDRGAGGKYLVLPPGYDGTELAGIVPDSEYFMVPSSSWVNWLLIRGFLKDGKPDFSSKLFRSGLKIYPFSAALNPPAMEFINGSGRAFNTVHANDFSFFEELHSVVDREPIEMFDPELRGAFAAIGIQKGKPFAPDDRMKEILTEAARLGNATVRALFWYERDESAFLYEGSYWKRGFVGGSHEYLKDHGLGGRNLNARAQYFYMATFNSPAMIWELIGKGSKYAWGYLDSNGDPLDGSKTYKLNLPKDLPAKKFVSVCVYDNQTRSMLQTDQRLPSKNSNRDDMARNEDGSIDVYFGPEAPAGKEANWIQTISGKGWFCLLRLYSPTEAWYDKTWRPGEIDLVE